MDLRAETTPCLKESLFLPGCTSGSSSLSPPRSRVWGGHHHTHQPERAEPQEQSRYRVDHYGKSRNFAAYEGSTIIAVTLYRKGAAEIMARLEETLNLSGFVAA
jgi:hypothetical protein